MKIFDTLQQLWEELIFCPICLDNSRVPSITAEDGFFIHSFGIDNFKLKISGNNNFSKYISLAPVHFEIDLKTNISRIINHSNMDKVCLHFDAECNKCHSYVRSFITVYFKTETISNIKIYSEDVYLFNDSHKYHITFLYHDNYMLISSLEIDQTGTLIDKNKVLRRAIINLDLSDVDKAINKIQTILVFS